MKENLAKGYGAYVNKEVKVLPDTVQIIKLAIPLAAKSEAGKEFFLEGSFDFEEKTDLHTARGAVVSADWKEYEADVGAGSSTQQPSRSF